MADRPDVPASIDSRQSAIGNRFVSRSGEKLEAALAHFGLEVSGKLCADLGSHVGGFVDCLLRRGAVKVYAVDTAYGILAWKLRKDPRVVIRERTNAMHVTLPEPVDLVTIDVGWTPQARIMPNVSRMLAPPGQVVTLIKPHYEALPDQLSAGVLPDDRVEVVVRRVLEEVAGLGWRIEGVHPSPIRGHGGNCEMFALLRRERPPSDR